MTNVAIRKVASQSSNGDGTRAGLAVDGFPWTRYPYCALTNPLSDGTKERWWRVYLIHLYTISYVVITNLLTNRSSLTFYFLCLVVHTHARTHMHH